MDIKCNCVNKTYEEIEEALQDACNFHDFLSLIEYKPVKVCNKCEYDSLRDHWDEQNHA
jgi:hypothetical protein